VAAFVAPGHDTVKEQQSPAAARSSVQRAVAAVLAAAGPGTVTSVGPYRQVGRCSLTADRKGVDYAQVADVYGPAARLAGFAGRLPSGYAAKSEPSLVSGDRLTVAHPDPFLRLTVRAAKDDTGHLIATVDTGCRPTTGHPYPAFLAPVDESERAAARRVFALFDVAPSGWRRATVDCGATTVTGTGRARMSIGPLGEVLDDHPQPGSALTRNDSRYVYLDHGRGLVVSADRDRLTVTATTPCR